MSFVSPHAVGVRVHSRAYWNQYVCRLLVRCVSFMDSQNISFCAQEEERKKRIHDSSEFVSSFIIISHSITCSDYHSLHGRPQRSTTIPDQVYVSRWFSHSLEWSKLCSITAEPVARQCIMFNTHRFFFSVGVPLSQKKCAVVGGMSGTTRRADRDEIRNGK